MAYVKPTIEPVEHEAGTSLIFTRAIDDYPADTWTLTYELRNATAAPITITATQDGTSNDYAINEAASTTQTWTAGDYWMVGYVTDGTDRHKVYEAWVTIKPYVAGEMAYDARSFARQMRDRIRDAMLTGASSVTVSYSINGRSFTRSGKDEMRLELGYWENKVRWEEFKGKQRHVKVRFRSPHND